MGLNHVKNGSQMYDWITATFNTIKGACPHNCGYCYMKRYGKQKPVRFDEKELKTDLGKDNFIFVGSSCDMFASKIYKKWITDTIEYCKKFNNRYLFQTKNMKRLYEFSEQLPKNSITCTTIETNRWYPEIMNNGPYPYDRAFYLGNMPNRYLTIEPIMAFDLKELVGLVKLCRPLQTNIGANTFISSYKYGVDLPEPSKEEILALVDKLEKFTIVKLKKNLNRLLK